MGRMETLSAKDLPLVVDSIFAIGAPTVYETYSRFDSDTLSFADANKFSRFLAVPRPVKQSQLMFSIYYLDTLGFVEKIRIELDPKSCEGHTFRYQISGWGLIQFHLDLRDAKLIACRVGVNSEKRANMWSNTYPAAKSPDLWDWKIVEKHARRITRSIRKHAQQIGYERRSQAQISPVPPKS